MSIDKVIKNSTFLLTLAGGFSLILGIVLILVWWHEVVILFRGFLGIILALAGMLLLYMAKE